MLCCVILYAFVILAAGKVSFTSRFKAPTWIGEQRDSQTWSASCRDSTNHSFLFPDVSLAHSSAATSRTPAVHSADNSKAEKKRLVRREVHTQQSEHKSSPLLIAVSSLCSAVDCLDESHTLDKRSDILNCLFLFFAGVLTHYVAAGWEEPRIQFALAASV